MMNQHDERLLLRHLRKHFTDEQLRQVEDEPLTGPGGLRRQLAEIDFSYFREAYFSHWMQDGAGTHIPPAEFHEDLAREFERVRDSGGGERIAWAAPRGNAKSANTSVFYVAWNVLYQLEHYILVIMDTFPQAKLQMGSLKEELENNERILEDFGPQQGEVWQEAVIETVGGVRVEALGAGMKVRGRRWKQYRPGLIICDDLENDESVKTPKQREKLSRWFWRAVDKAGNRRTNIFVLGTILHYDSLLNNLLKHHRYRSRKYRAIIQEAERQDLWDQWVPQPQVQGDHPGSRTAGPVGPVGSHRTGPHS